MIGLGRVPCAYSPNEVEALMGIQVGYYAWYERYLVHLAQQESGDWAVDWFAVVAAHGE